MEIIKRNGTSEIYNNKKILRAIRKSFESTGKAISDQDIAGMVAEVEKIIIDNPAQRTVEEIQNQVEKHLMMHGHY